MVWDFYTTLGGRLIAERLHTGYTFFLRNGGFLKLSWNRNLQGITAPFEISPRVDCIPPGRYSWTEYMLYASSGPAGRCRSPAEPSPADSGAGASGWSMRR